MSSVRGAFEPIQSLPSYQRVADAIEQAILAGELQPGEHLGTEAELVDSFRVNRSTVREGIRVLEQSGLIRRDRSRRLIVSLPRMHRLSSRITRALALYQVTFQELWEATMAVEPASVQIAAGRASPEELDAIADNVAATRLAVDDPVRLAELDTEFHTLVTRASGNRVLMLAREPLGMLILPSTELIFRQLPQAHGRLVKAHGEILDGLRRGDATHAREWMLRHVMDFRRGFEQAGVDMSQSVERLYLDRVVRAGRRPADEEHD